MKSGDAKGRKNTLFLLQLLHNKLIFVSTSERLHKQICQLKCIPFVELLCLLDQVAITIRLLLLVHIKSVGGVLRFGRFNRRAGEIVPVKMNALCIGMRAAWPIFLQRGNTLKSEYDEYVGAAWSAAHAAAPL